MYSRSKSAILVVSPHPDDMEIGMGGSVALAAAIGTRVVSAVLTDGRRSFRSFQCSDDEMAQIRREEAERAAAVLGVERVCFLGLHDLRSKQNQARAKAELIELLNDIRPDQIYIPHPQLDRHETHRTGAGLCLETLRTVDFHKPVVWAYEVWGVFAQWDRLEDISEAASKKAEAIECHSSQTKDTDYAQGALGLNRWRAVFADPHKMPSHRYVEAFIKLCD